MRFALITFSLLLGSATALAWQAPHNMTSGRSGLIVQTLGATCFSINESADSLPCNPAYMAKKRYTAFKANIFIGNNVSYLSQAVEVAKGEATQETIETLFSKRNSSEFESSLDVAYLTETFGLSYEPFRASFYSYFQNQALPEVTAFASVEDSARLQLASYTQNDFFVGLQLRYLHRQTVSSRFFLTDVMAENRNDFLKPKDQKFIFLEPGFLYSPEDNEWRPELTFNIINWSFKTGEDLASDPVPEYHLGSSFSYVLGYGRMGWAVDFGWNRDIVNASEIPTLATYFEIGILKAFGSLAQKANAVGFSVHFDTFNLGLSYSSQAEGFDSASSSYTRRLYFLLGAEI